MFGWLRRALPKGSDPVAPQAVEGKIEVTDADTIWVGDEKFRLVGFDAPETTHAKSEHEYRMGEAAADRLRELIAPPNKLKLERLAGSDIHERGLARLYINGRDVAEIAIEEGWGVPFDGNRRRSDEMPDWDGMKYPK